MIEAATLSAIKGIRHGFFTREGGFSSGLYSSLNTGLGSDDDRETVKRNRAKICGELGVPTLVTPYQVHSPDAVIVEMPWDHDEPDSVPRADAVVTDRSENYLVIQVADCQSVLMYEPVRRVVANVHSGWRGSIQNIIGCTVDAMKQYFGCSPDDILAGIGPSLGPCCAQFINYETEIPKEFWDYKDPDDHFDFWAISTDQLMKAGVRERNIESSQMCTRCRTEEFFSFRAEKTTGRFASVIGLKGMKNEY